MFKTSLFSVICLLFVGCSYFPGSNPRHSEDRMVAFRVRCQQGSLTSHGSGFSIRHGGRTYIVTAGHVIRGGGVISIHDSLGYVLPYTPVTVYDHVGSDVALIHVSSISPRVRQLSVGEMSVGFEAEGLGFPGEQELVESWGKIFPSPIKTSLRIHEGMSGGPVIQKGKAVGVLNSRLIDKNEDREYTLISDLLDALQTVP